MKLVTPRFVLNSTRTMRRTFLLMNDQLLRLALMTQRIFSRRWFTRPTVATASRIEPGIIWEPIRNSICVDLVQFLRAEDIFLYWAANTITIFTRASTRMNH